MNCYFVENSKWVKVDNSDELLTVSCLRIKFTSTKDIECNPITKKVIKTEENARTVDIITLRAQSLRGHGSISCQYFKLKRTCKKLKKNLINSIKCYRDQQLAQVQNEEKKKRIKRIFLDSNRLGQISCYSGWASEKQLYWYERYFQAFYSVNRKLSRIRIFKGGKNYTYLFLFSDLYIEIRSFSILVFQTFHTVHHVQHENFRPPNVPDHPAFFTVPNWTWTSNVPWPFLSLFDIWKVQNVTIDHGTFMQTVRYGERF